MKVHDPVHLFRWLVADWSANNVFKMAAPLAPLIPRRDSMTPARIAAKAIMPMDLINSS